ncbi:hypothetical protein QM565_12425 [Geitlerinema splendidum]|nr:hypothetical protein [Geitlerinema splendidum]
MAAPEKSEKRPCPRCFAMNLAEATFCEECGASLDSESEGSDAEVYQDLSRANLLRIRGESKAAIDVCLSILRRYPNNISAHSLLGEIYLEQDDFKQATEWFEMAVDLAPDSKREMHLLERARSLYKSQNEKSTIDQLEIPKRPNNTLYAVGMVVLLVIVGFAAFMAGAQRPSQSKESQRISEPIVIPPSPAITNEPTTPQPEEDPTIKIQQDEIVLARLQALPDRGKQIQSFILDPATQTAVVTATQGLAESAEVAALLISSDVFSNENSITQLTVRISSFGSLIFSGKLTRTQYDEARVLATSTSLATVAKQVFANAWRVPSIPPTGGATEPKSEENQTPGTNNSGHETGTIRPGTTSNGVQPGQGSQTRSNPGGE